MKLTRSKGIPEVSRLFVVAAAELVPRVAGGDGAPRELALIANAFAKARAMAHVQPLMKAVSARAVEQIESCNAQDWSWLLTTEGWEVSIGRLQGMELIV